MPEDCIFCQIIDGEIPVHDIYENDDVLAFLDANPLAEGHTLVIPKEHHETTDSLSEDLGGVLGRTVTRLSPAVESAVGAEASTIGVNNGEAAGQTVPHLHVHIVPRNEGDGGGTIHSIVGGQTTADDDELAAVANDIQAGL